MARDVDKEHEEHLNNGNRFFTNASGSTGALPRDVDKLFHRYQNLRYSVYAKYKNNFHDDASRNELMSYINEQFTRLVREYNTTVGVDFPGYVKGKLEKRVFNSFIRKMKKDSVRESPTKGEFDVANWADQDPSNDNELEYYEILEYVFDGVELDDLQRSVLFHIMQEKTDIQVEKDVREAMQIESKSRSIRRITREMRNLLKEKLYESLHRRHQH